MFLYSLVMARLLMSEGIPVLILLSLELELSLFLCGLQVIPESLVLLTQQDCFRLGEDQLVLQPDHLDR